MLAFSRRRAHTVLQLLFLVAWARWLALDVGTIDQVGDVVMGLVAVCYAGFGIANWREDGPE